MGKPGKVGEKSGTGGLIPETEFWPRGVITEGTLLPPRGTQLGSGHGWESPWGPG